MLYCLRDTPYISGTRPRERFPGLGAQKSTERRIDRTSASGNARGPRLYGAVLRPTRALEYIFIVSRAVSRCNPLYPTLYPAASRCIPLYPAASRCIPRHPAVSRFIPHIPLYHSASRCIPLYPALSRCIPLYPAVSSISRPIPLYPSVSRCIPPCPTYTPIYPHI